MNISNRIKSALVGVVAVPMIAIAPAAQAADVCPGLATDKSASIAIAVDGNVNAVGTPLKFSYEGCHRTVGDRYTLQITRDYRDANGNLVRQPVTQLKTVSRAGQTGGFSGTQATLVEGGYTATEAGRYVVNVTYYREGQTNFEADAEAIFRIASTPTTPEVPVTPTTPVVSAQPAKLPNTGAGEVMGVFAAVTLIGTAMYRRVLNRRFDAQ